MTRLPEIKFAPTPRLNIAIEQYGPENGTPVILLQGFPYSPRAYDKRVGPAPADDEDAHHFTGPYERRVLAGVGHNIPEEAPGETLKALQGLLQR